MSDNSVFSKYDKNIHRIGIISSVLLLASLVLVPLGAQIIFGQTVEWKPTLGAMGGALAVFGPVAVIEFLSYAPIIGAGGQYLSFATGNIMNMKVPAATAGRKIAEVETGSPEGDAISIISIAVSSITTTVILFVGMVLASQLLPLLETPALAPAFANVMPAIMGALGFPVIVKDFRIAIVPGFIAIMVTLIKGYGAFSGTNQGPMMIVFLLISLLWAYFLHKRDQKQKTEA